MTIPKILLTVLTLGGMVLYLAGCSKEDENSLGFHPSTCDTTNVSYKLQVLPILQTYCYQCHSPGNTAGSGGIDLSTVDNLRVFAGNGGYLIGNVRHDPGFNFMPYDQPKLPDCEINTIVAWVHQGTQNN